MTERNNKNKLQELATEDFVEIDIDDELKLRYAISNFGRLVSFSDKIEYGRILKGSITEGYRILRYKIRRGRKISYRHKFFHRLVAETFLVKTSDEQAYVLHLDHDLSNDHVFNLKWATKQEMLAHHRTNSKVLKARKRSGKRLRKYNENKEIVGQKLSKTQVLLIKTLLSHPERKTSQKIIAREFGISEMQVYRIKSGENWGHIKIDEQPDTASRTGNPAAEKIKKNKRPLTEKKIELTQKPKKEPTKQKKEGAWDEHLKAYLNGEKNDLISRWINENRKQFRDGKLSLEKIEKLIEINFPFVSEAKIKKSDGWDGQLEEWKKGNRKSFSIQLWKQRSIRRFVEGKLSRDRIAKLKEVGILK